MALVQFNPTILSFLGDASSDNGLNPQSAGRVHCAVEAGHGHRPSQNRDRLEPIASSFTDTRGKNGLYSDRARSIVYPESSHGTENPGVATNDEDAAMACNASLPVQQGPKANAATGSESGVVQESCRMTKRDWTLLRRWITQRYTSCTARKITEDLNARGYSLT